MGNLKEKFAKIYDKYVDKIYRFVFLKVESQEIAEDLTSIVFTKGWKKFKKGEDIKNISAYLYQIARAEIANYHRERAKFPTISTEATQIPIVDPKPNSEQTQEFQSDLVTIKNCLAKLNNNYQDVLVWRYIDGYSNKEIAEMLGKSKGAVRVMIHRALKELKELCNEIRFSGS
ncbi:sigma-70 family RNA polymerase sigma factor [bacterium]|nr:sigma-70 family RNA polymerase sigma factor [bacterium]